MDLWISECPYSDGGQIRPLRTESGRVVLMCDAGGEVWLDPDSLSAGDAIYPSRPDWVVAEGVHVRPNTTAWASPDDLAGLRWSVEWRSFEAGAVDELSHDPSVDSESRMSGGSTLVWDRDMEEMRLSEEHMSAIAEWMLGQPVGVGSPDGLVILRRFVRQMCGRALACDDTSLLDVAFTAALVCGAWVGDTGGDKEWRQLSFVVWSANTMGIDSERYLEARCGELPPEIGNAVLATKSRLGAISEPVDHLGDRYVAVSWGTDVDFDACWDDVRHHERQKSSERRLSLIEKTAEHYRSQGGEVVAARFRDRASTIALPWLRPTKPVFESADRLGESRTELLRWLDEGSATSFEGIASPMCSTADLAEFVREQASLGSRDRDTSRLNAALAVAAHLAPRLLGLPGRAAHQVLGDQVDSWLIDCCTSFSADGSDGVESVLIGRRPPFDLAGYVETGLVGGLRFSLGWPISAQSG